MNVLEGSHPTHLHDWAWQIGTWNVRHRRLRQRLAASDDWEDFPGTCTNWSLMGGQGNIEDNLLELPSGPYQAIALRNFDASTGLWSIWWLDARTPNIDPPVRGAFADGVGTFMGDDIFEGRPIKVRFLWTGMATGSPRWEQAFSEDGGLTWEVNWVMDFTRAA